MRTEDLIDALSRDAGRFRPGVERSVLEAVCGGLAVTAMLFFLLLGLRPDLSAGLMMSWFGLKVAFTITLVIASFFLVLALARPAAKPLFWPFAVVAALLVAAIVGDLWLYGMKAAPARLIGKNAIYCLTSIPVFAAAPLAAMLLALRHGAPTRPGLAGAAAGLSCGALGAFFYAWHCTDDSPLFVATWYSLAIAILTAAGALLGKRLLRW